MRALALTAALASSGCFTSWAVVQAIGGQKAFDESVREQTVPLDGVTEKLAVSLPLDVAYEYAGAVSTGAQEKTPLAFALTCSTKQYARDRTYHSAFRYGSRWKKTTAISFLIEAALGGAFLLIDRNRDQSDPMKANDRSGLLAGAFFALDAVGTAAIFFIPRKEVYTVEDKAVMTPIREDCPEGLVLDIGGTSFPVDAAGHIGDTGELALDDWMRAPTGTIALTFEGRAMPLQISAREQCAWLRARDPKNTTGNPNSPSVASANPSIAPDSAPADDVTTRACNASGPYVTTTDLPRRTTAVITVPTGSLSLATSPAPTTDSR